MSTEYSRHKDKTRERQMRMTLAGREIGTIPPVGNKHDREACRLNFREFCETYFARVFTLKWSPDHLRIIAKIEDAVLRGGLFALAMPRGSGKTSLCETACIWALLYGHRRFVVLIGAEAGLATQSLNSIKSEFESNEPLGEDFPEVCYPITALEGITHRCKGQLLNGERTQIQWSADKVVFPTVPGSAASGSVIEVAGITGQIRGLKHKTAAGEAIRPDLVVIDDPQTDDSAASASQCATRERVLMGAVLGLAGPDKTIAGIMPCTVVRPADLADRILDRTRRPQWNGERTKMVYEFPADSKCWEQYAELRAEGLRAGDGGKAATNYYAANREMMDAGAVVAWPERYRPGELSAIQSAMNLKLQDEAAFFAEYQNEPLPLVMDGSRELVAAEIAERINRQPRGIAPAEATALTAFIDVGEHLLYYAVCAWEPGFTGYVVDYGTYPDQERPYFTAKDAAQTLGRVTQIATLEGSLYAGLTACADHILDRDYGPLRVGRCAIDAGWGMSTDIVFRWIKQSKFAPILYPSFGKYIGAGINPMHDWPVVGGQKRGNNWLVPLPKPGKVRHLLYDTNHWKSFVSARLTMPLGERGSMTLFGERSAQHRCFADHMTAETATQTSGRGRTLEEWRIKPHKPDNHWWDCLVGCAVLASVEGITLADVGQPKKLVQRVSYKEMQAARRQQR